VILGLSFALACTTSEAKQSARNILFIVLVGISNQLLSVGGRGNAI
jgi:hypothetical protein